ncbi:MAG: T9SS type A sorting domain-containing protein, partial [Bacteroidia bacterium]
EGQLSIYPVPATDQIFVQVEQTNFQDVVIDIVDVSGRSVYSQRVQSNSTALNYSIDLSLFESGVYIVTVKTDQASGSGRIIKN